MPLLVLLLLGLCAAGSASALVFEPDLRGEWRFARQGEVCELSRTLGPYGHARFYGEPGHSLAVEIVPRRDFFSHGPIRVLASAPEWRSEHPLTAARGTLHHVRGGVASARDPLATSLLMDLYAGFTVRLEQDAWYEGAPVRLTLSPTRLQPSYDAFADCYQWLMPANYEDVERTRLLFAPGQAGLDARHKTMLRAVAEYVLADRTVRRVFVDGHADASGDERSNMRLSQRRAEAVAAWLQSRGVPKALLVVRFHASRYPVTQGASAEAQRANRRATVRLERAREGSVAGV